MTKVGLRLGASILQRVGALRCPGLFRLRLRQCLHLSDAVAALNRAVEQRREVSALHNRSHSQPRLFIRKAFNRGFHPNGCRLPHVRIEFLQISQGVGFAATRITRTTTRNLFWGVAPSSSARPCLVFVDTLDRMPGFAQSQQKSPAQDRASSAAAAIGSQTSDRLPNVAKSPRQYHRRDAGRPLLRQAMRLPPRA